jgi:translocation and assembly module TamB
MTRGQRIGLILASSIAGLLLVLVVAGILIVRTPWFANFVRQKIVSSVEEASGGAAQVGGFSFDWTHLRAQVRNFVLHGSEPSGAAPLFQAKLIEVDLKLLSPLKGFVDIAYLLVDTPQASVIVFPDGSTNIPAPKLKKPSNRSGLETIVDLAIGKFEINHGNVNFADRKLDFNASGQNLVAHLSYHTVNPSYSGELDMNPLYLKSGKNQTVDVNVKLPVTLEKDKISLANAQLTTLESQVVISGSMDHMLAPSYAAHVNARIALDEVQRAAGLNIALDTRNGPRVLNADLTASMDRNRVQIQSARLSLGQSNLEAAGTLRAPGEAGSVEFNASVALGQIARLLRVTAQPEGTVYLGGNAALRGAGDYIVTANLDARNLSVREDGTRLSGIQLASSITADPHRVQLGGLRINLLGGSFAGSASLVEMAQFRVMGTLRDFDSARVAGVFLNRPLDYDGVVSGPVEAEGNVKALANLTARADLSIASGRSGIPVSGRLNVDYNGRADTVLLGPSYLALPNSRIDLAGSLGQQIQVRLVTHNMSDFRPLANIPLTFNNGAATVNANVRGKLSAPSIAGHVALTNFAVEGRPFTSFVADGAASRSAASISNASLARGRLQAQLAASVGLRDWKPEPAEPLRVDATVRNADLGDVLALAGQANVPANGALAADAHITGTIGSPQGAADFTVRNGSVAGEHFDQLSARAAMTDRSIDVPSLQLTAGPSRADASATYQHALNDLKTGTLRARVASNQVQLADFQPLVKNRPRLSGTLSLNGDLAAVLMPDRAGEQVNVTTANANLAVRGLQIQGQNLGDLTATANTAGSEIQYNVNSDFARSTIRVNGQTLLTGNHDTTAMASIMSLPIDKVLEAAGRSDIPVSGVLAADAKVSGTFRDPHANASFTITKGTAYQEPFDRLQATVEYSNQRIDVPSLRFTAGPSELDLSASLAHPASDFDDGQLRFQVRSNQLQLGRFHTVNRYKPGLAGTIQVNAEGAAALRRNQAPLFSTLNANLNARGLSVNGKPAGDLTASAETQGRGVDFNLKSDFAHTNINGTGRMELAGDYPLDARMTFSNVTYSGLSVWTGATQDGFDASADGQVTLTGPVMQADMLRATLQLSKLEAHSVSPATGVKPRFNFQAQNAGPVVVALNRSVVTIQNARLTGQDVELSVTGTASLQSPKTVDIRTSGNVKLEVLQAFSPSVFSSGSVVLNATVTGTTAQPMINGRLQLQNASFNLLSLPNGISNANGSIAFNGTEALIENVTGESGGGKVTLAGYVAYGGPEMQFRVDATVDRVRVTYPQTVTTEASARLTLAGSASTSLVSGNVTILDVALNAQSDIGSILTQASTPPSTPAASSGLLGGVRFDVRIQTSPATQFRTTLTENLQADANLILRGAIDQPGMLGRVTITAGDVVFFGTKYMIDQGTLSFYDPSRINPVMNVDLETTVQGIHVSVSVAGPLDRMKLSYHSDPPLQFTEIVSLLATGTVSTTTDPVLAARQPPAPQQSFTQMGASALLGQAAANPVSGRLQQLFGVTRLSINPQIAGTTNTPAATVTLQQQISKDITFTYIQDVTQSNPEIISMEWVLSPQWSAVAQRDIYGELNLNFYYKKRFW